MPFRFLAYTFLVSVGAALSITYIFWKDAFGWTSARGINPRRLLAVTVLAIVVGRVVIVFATPDRDNNIDLSIYREVGELVIHGVDPYNFTEERELREKLKSNDVGAQELSVKESYDYYVSANLPGSAVLYGLIEFISRGTPKAWRIAFILGDILIALSGYFFLRRAGIGLNTVGQQLAFFVGVAGYPSLIEWGTFWPEDKQFQTAMMLFLAGLFVGTPRSRINSAIAIGATGCLSILFKAFGVFLVPAALHYFIKRPRVEFLVAAGVFVATAAPFALHFDLSFVRLMADRLSTGSSYVAFSHASPWQFLPIEWVSIARPAICVTLVISSIVLYLRRQIDLLNCSAAVLVIFVCLWLNGGSMDRMNVAMIFALFCLATMSPPYWQVLTVFNFVAQIPFYAIIVVQHFRSNPMQNLEQLDATVTVIFLVPYFVVLLIARRRQLLGLNEFGGFAGRI